MKLFGQSKREKELETKIEQLELENKKLLSENEQLAAQACPEKKLLDELQERITAAQAQLKTEESRQNALIRKGKFLDEQISEQHININRNNQIIANQQHEIQYNDLQLDIQEFGIYTPKYEFANSDLYKDALKRCREEQKEQIKGGYACTGAKNWTVDGNKSKGTKMVKDMQKLLLRAFNTECDDIISAVKVSNYERSLERIEKARETISKCASIMSIEIGLGYKNLKRQELSLALDFAQKKQEEKERLKELREQQREEAKAQKEIEEARKKLQKEQTHYQNALQTITSQLEKEPDNPDLLAKKKELENNIEDAAKAIADVDYREANKRAGYVYIISNIGAFGEGVYKIGMTRRLEPMERINELGDASVPFNFDVHALIFTEDAPKLEAALHTAFEDRKVNKINPRREFFRVSLEEIKKVVRENFDKTVEWKDFPEAEQYRQSI